MPANIDSPDDKVWAPQICRQEGVTDRCHRNWIASGKFPPPNGNMNGRNFWLRSTYEQWKADVLAGKFCQRRRPGVREVVAA
jgi:hypothetical protein